VRMTRVSLVGAARRHSDRRLFATSIDLLRTIPITNRHRIRIKRGNDGYSYCVLRRFPLERSTMAKARISTPSGIGVNVEGTAAEILAVVEELDRKQAAAGESASRKSRREKQPRPGRITLASRLASLVEEGFFDQPRELGAIKAELDTNGHFYPITTLSGAILSQVRKKNVRRLRKDGRWLYVRAA
jgi:hypothetical protein